MTRYLTRKERNIWTKWDGRGEIKFSKYISALLLYYTIIVGKNIAIFEYYRAITLLQQKR